MKISLAALAAMFIFTAGFAPDLAAQSNMSASKVPSKTGKGSYNGPSDYPGRPSYNRPGQGQGSHGRPPGGSSGQHRPGGNRPGDNRPGDVNAPSVKPDHGPAWGSDRRDERFKKSRRNRDCWPNGCGGNYYGYYYDDPYKVEQEAPRDQNITITIVEPEPRTYFSSGGLFEPFDDPRDKQDKKKK